MNKYALITGASGGIGSAVAKRLAADGYLLYLHYNQGYDQIDKLMQTLGEDKCFSVQANLSEESGAEMLWEQIHHPVSTIVYTAGKSVFGLVTDVQNDELESMTRLNVTNLYKLVNFALPNMIREKSGNIAVISSIWGQTGASCEVLYSMLKGAQNTYVKALAKEVALSGVRVNAIAPGAVETEMMNMFSEEDKRSIAEEIPLGRLAQAEEIANVVSFLLSEQASYITGQVLGVNGGWYC
jgi:3-oxoacyl-[acyl-carrier protein] reductase